jgi:hypothetical protein
MPLVTLNVKTALAQLTDRYEVVATLEQPSQIQSGTTLSELNFSVTYDISSVLMFSEETNIVAPEGLIGHWIEHQPTDVSITDNLGNSFSPIINNNSIMTPFISNITIPSFFEYRITLHFRTIDDVEFLDEISNFVMSYTETQTGSPVPMIVTFRLPRDYSVFQQTEGANITIDNQYNSFTWQFTQGRDVQCFAVFMPYSIKPTVRSMAFTIEALTPSARSMLRETFSMTYDLIGTVMIWNISLVMPISVGFPNNMSGTEVESVSDGQGVCELRTLPIDVESGDPLGKYFVDNSNKVVKIYPRNTYQDETQKFDVKITFIVPNNSSSDPDDPNIPFWQPYRGFTKFTPNFDPNNSSILLLNITGNFKVTFVFPPEQEPISSIDEETFALGKSEDGRTTAVFNYNSPINLPQESWGVIFDNISQRDFHNYQSANILVLIIGIVVVSVALLLVSKTALFQTNIGVFEAVFELISLSAILGSVVVNFKDFIVLGWFDLWIVTCVIMQFLFSAILIILMLYFYRKRKTIERINPQRQKHKPKKLRCAH